MNLSEIADCINNRSANYRMGRFQSLRKELKGLTKLRPREIFTYQTISEEWAFHYGGRKEIQFNIGFEPRNNYRFFRHGLAFSLERNQTLPDIEILFSHIERFNDYIHEAASEFSDMRMWHWYKGKLTEYPTVQEISPECLKSGFFIFLGKLTNPAEINIGSVLEDFDRLLNIYAYVEGKGKTIRTIAPEKDLVFNSL